MKRFSFFLLSFFIYLSCLVYPGSVHASTFKFSPASATFNQYCHYSLDIVLDTGGSLTNAADIIVTYDPFKIEILDSDIGQTGVQIKTGNVFQNYFGNIVDKSQGLIRLTGASFTGFFSSVGTFATIQFRPLLNNTNGAFTIRFTGANPYNTLDSNIASALTSTDILTSVENSFFAFSSGSCVADSAPPVITFVSPVNGQLDVPASANIEIDIADPDSGVDLNQTDIIINGVSYHSGDPRVTVTGNSQKYHFLIKPYDPLFTTASNTVLVKAIDYKGNSKSATIVFNQPALPPPTGGPLPTCLPAIIPTPICPVAPQCPVCPITSVSITHSPDISPAITPTPPDSSADQNSPVINFIKPKNKDKIDSNSYIVFRVTDSGSGIDPDSLKVTLGNTVYTSDLPGFSLSGGPNSYDITLKTSFPLPPDTQQQLTVFVSDSSGNAVSQSIFVTTKTPIINYLRLILFGLLSLIAGGFLLRYFLPFFFKPKTSDLTPYGQVFDSATLEPINRVKVSIYNSQGKVTAVCSTNIFGIFAAKLEVGKYKLMFSHRRFTTPPSANYLLYIDATSRPFVSVPLKLVAADKKPHPLYGIVTNQHGVRIPGLTLALTSLDTGVVVATRYTDAQGGYRFLVPHGHYQVSAPEHTLSADPVIDTRHLTFGYTVINQNLVVLK